MTWLSCKLAPSQLGFGVRCGAEAAVHALRVYVSDLRQLHSNQQNHCLVKLDFFATFLTLSAGRMMQAMKELCSDLFPLVYSSYASPSLLFWSDKIINSAEGVQQGDPLGSLLFCLTIHSLVSHLSSEFCVWYLDPGWWHYWRFRWSCVWRPQVDYPWGCCTGLIVEWAKIWTIYIDFFTSLSSVVSCISSAQLTQSMDATLLGSPFGETSSISFILSNKIQLLQAMGERLQYFFCSGCTPLAQKFFFYSQSFVCFENCSGFLVSH